MSAGPSSSAHRRIRGPSPARVVAVLIATLVVAWSAAACGDDGPPTGSDPSQFSLRWSRLLPTTGVAGRALDTPLSVRVFDGGGRPVAGVPVAFAVLEGAGTLSRYQAITDTLGEARTVWTLGSSPGRQVLRARADDVGELLAAVDATPGESLDLLSGNGQTAPVGGVLPDPIRVRIVDGSDRPVPGRLVTFEVVSGGGAVDADGGGEAPADTAATDADGIAGALWRLGPSPGAQAARVRAGLRTVDVTATAGSGPSVTVEISPAEVEVPVGAEQSFTAVARDAFGNVTRSDGFVWATSTPRVLALEAAPDGSSARGTAATAGWAQVTAATPGGIGSAAVTVAPVGTGPAGPGVVDDLAVSAVGPDEVTLTFTQVDDGRGDPASYELRRGSPTLDWALATASTAAEGTAVGQPLELVVDGLLPATAYQFQLQAYRDTLGARAVTGPLSNTVSATTDAGSSLPVARVEAAVPGAALAALGAQLRVTAAAFDIDGVPVATTFGFTSLDPAVAVVDPTTGVVTAQGNGTATIRVEAGDTGVGDEVTVTVDQVAVGLSVLPLSAAVAPGGERRFTATVEDANGNAIFGRSVLWSSADERVATVDAEGRATGVSDGVTRITAATAAGEPLSASATLRVAANAGGPAFVQDWSYADQRAFLSASELRHVCNPDFGRCDAVAGVRTQLLTGLSDTPWGGSRAARSYFAHIDTARVYRESASRTMVEWTFPDAAGRDMDHVWIQMWIRFSTSPQWSEPSAGGQKTIFLDAANYSRIAEMRWSNFVLHARAWNNGSPRGLAALGVDNRTFSFDGEWHEVRLERRIGRGDGIIRFKVDDLLVADSVNADFPGDRTANYFASMSLGETSGNTCHLCYIDWGEIRVYTSDPGWSW